MLLVDRTGEGDRQAIEQLRELDLRSHPASACAGQHRIRVHSRGDPTCPPCRVATQREHHRAFGWPAGSVSIEHLLMLGRPSSRRFGLAWLTFTAALALHVFDEAIHDFLSVYNPTAVAIRARVPSLPLPTFTFAVWLTGLCAGIALLVCISPLAFRRTQWTRIAAWPLGIVVGVFNASLHLLSSAYYHRWMPGVYSSPLLLAAALFLLVSSRSQESSVNVNPHAAESRQPKASERSEES